MGSVFTETGGLRLIRIAFSFKINVVDVCGGYGCGDIPSVLTDRPPRSINL